MIRFSPHTLLSLLLIIATLLFNIISYCHAYFHIDIIDIGYYCRQLPLLVNIDWLIRLPLRLIFHFSAFDYRRFLRHYWLLHTYVITPHFHCRPLSLRSQPLSLFATLAAAVISPLLLITSLMPLIFSARLAFSRYIIISLFSLHIITHTYAITITLLMLRHAFCHIDTLIAITTWLHCHYTCPSLLILLLNSCHYWLSLFFFITFLRWLLIFSLLIHYHLRYAIVISMPH